MKRAIERRRRPRLPLRLRASIRRQGSNQQSDAATENLNCDGVCFRSEESFVLGELLEIRLDLDGVLGASHGHSSLVCLGKVVQAESDDPSAPFRYGCEILDYNVETAGAAGRRQSGAAVAGVTVS